MIFNASVTAASVNTPAIVAASPGVIVAVTFPSVASAIAFASAAEIAPVIVTAGWPTLANAKAVVTLATSAAFEVIVCTEEKSEVSNRVSKSTKALASAVLSVDLNFKTSLWAGFTSLRAFRVAATLPALIVAVTTPFVAFAIAFASAAEISPVIFTATLGATSFTAFSTSATSFASASIVRIALKSAFGINFLIAKRAFNSSFPDKEVASGLKAISSVAFKSFK